MNIDIVKIRFKDKELGEQTTYKYLPFEYCCERLRGFDKIIFCDELDTFGSDDVVDDTDSVYPKFAFHTEEYEPWEKLPYDYYYKIDYCPFCGEKININLTKEIDKSDTYTTFENARAAFKEALKETDSVKTRDRLDEEIQEVNNKISDMWEFGEYDD